MVGGYGRGIEVAGVGKVYFEGMSGRDSGWEEEKERDCRGEEWRRQIVGVIARRSGMVEEDEEREARRA